MRTHSALTIKSIATSSTVLPASINFRVLCIRVRGIVVLRSRYSTLYSKIIFLRFSEFLVLRSKSVLYVLHHRKGSRTTREQSRLLPPWSSVSIYRGGPAGRASMYVLTTLVSHACTYNICCSRRYRRNASAITQRE